jgi:hypothetical protein
LAGKLRVDDVPTEGGTMGGRGRNGILLESLEDRRLLAGDVSASVRHDTLIVTGDDAGNSFVITRQADDRTSFRVTPTDGTTINGSTAPLVFAGVSRGMSIEMRSGDDALTLDNVRVFGVVAIDAGDGHDAIVVRSSRITEDLIMSGGDGRDWLTVTKSTIQRDLLLDGGLAKDRFQLWQSHVRRRLSLSDTSGVSLIEIGRATLDGPAYVRTGDAMDDLVIDSSTFKSTAVFTTKGQDDHVKVRGTIFRHEAPILGGAGENVIDRQVILSWDFRDGQQGWGAGFSDYDAAPSGGFDAEGNPIPTIDRFRLESGLRPLPDELNVPGAGFLLSGANRSDDLFMYLRRVVGASDGVQPDTAYQVGFMITFASSVPAGLIGAGGAPAEAVFMKAGASPRKPRNLVIPGVSNFVLNTKKSNQSGSGSEVSVAGNIANGGPPDPNDVYRIVTREHVHPNPIRANDSGNMWLVVGTDSGFEGMTSLYYVSISVTLTPLS